MKEAEFYNAISLNFMPAYEESRRQIKKAMLENNLVVFIGAGTSVDSGIPGWQEAIAKIGARLGMEVRSSDTLKIPQYYFNARGKKEYTALMREIFRYKDSLPTKPVHDLILKFNANTIITTNYDHLLERAAEERGEFLHVVSKDSELPYKHGSEVIKMHGDFENDNFVLKEDDYLNYDRSFKLIKNYVTSLIGTKVVLFIGYGFNDPDVKQIFSWLKDALHGEFDQAYMISVDDYDENIADYYRNFGIHIIYSRVVHDLMRKRSFAENNQHEDYKKSENTNSDQVLTKTKSLTETLEWLLQENEQTFLDKLYAELGAYRYLNCANANDVSETLLGYDLQTEVLVEREKDKNDVANSTEDSLEPFDYSDPVDRPIFFGLMLSGESISSSIFSSKDWKGIPAKEKQRYNQVVLFFLKLCYIADSCQNSYPFKNALADQEWFRILDQQYKNPSDEIVIGGELVSGEIYKISQEEWQKLNDLLEVLRKSKYRRVMLLIEASRACFAGTTGHVQRDNELIQHYINIPLASLETSEAVTEIENFDYLALQDRKTHNRAIDFATPDMVLEQVHICYILDDYLQAYVLVKDAAGEFYKNLDYAKFFIAKCDQRRLGQTIIQSYGHYGADKANLSLIQKEIDDIDLDRILESIPDMCGSNNGGKEKNKFLRDLYTFNLDYQMMQSVLQISDKMDREADTLFLMYGGSPAYENLRTKIRNFYDYQVRNHFLIVNEEKTRNIYKMAVTALFKSVLAEDKETNRDAVNPNRFRAGNIHAHELRKTDIELAVKFSSASDLETVLRGHDNIAVSNSANHYIRELSANVMHQPESLLYKEDFFWKLIVICGHIKLTADLAEELLRELYKKVDLTDKDPGCRDAAFSLLDNIRKQEHAKNNKEIQNVLLKFVNLAFSKIDNPLSNVSINGIGTLGIRAAQMLDECNIKYEDASSLRGTLKVRSFLDKEGNSQNNTFIKKRIRDSNQKVVNHFLADIYPYCGDGVKKIIRNWFNQWTCKDDADDFQTYCSCVQNGILDINTDIENHAILFLKNGASKLDLRRKENDISSEDNAYIQLAYSIVNQVILGHFTKSEALINVCRELHMDAVAWVLDPNNDELFEHFEPSWLGICGDMVLAEFANDNNLHEKIGNRMRESYLRGEYSDPDLIGKYVKYFA